MKKFLGPLLAATAMLYLSNAAAQVSVASTAAAKLQKPASAIQPAPSQKPLPTAGPAAIAPLAPVVPVHAASTPVTSNAAPDPEALVQAEIKRLEKERDRINSAVAGIGAAFSRLTFTPSGNSCVDPDTTWNPRSGESFACLGMTTCLGRQSRWSKNRTNPCDPGVVIDSCVTSTECKVGFVCRTDISKCVSTSS